MWHWWEGVSRDEFHSAPTGRIQILGVVDPRVSPGAMIVAPLRGVVVARALLSPTHFAKNAEKDGAREG